jgi:hypothetical protein
MSPTSPQPSPPFRMAERGKAPFPHKFRLFRGLTKRGQCQDALGEGVIFVSCEVFREGAENGVRGGARSPMPFEKLRDSAWQFPAFGEDSKGRQSI